MTGLVLSLVAVVTSGVSAFVAWQAQRRAAVLVERYAEAIAVVAFVARADPPVAAPYVRTKCAQILAAHQVDVTFTVEQVDGRVH